jgi:hypothetical protein
LLLDFHLLSDRLDSTSDPAELRSLRDECLALDGRFRTWEATRPAEFMPSVAGQVTGCPAGLQPGVGRWPGPVYTYLDHFVSGVWGVIYAVRLMLASFIIEVSHAIGDDTGAVESLRSGEQFAEDMASLIPYHLVDNLQAFVGEQTATTADITDYGKFLGGFLLMHPLYTASTIKFLSPNIRGYFRRCLLWIGSEMGIAQAALLAKVSFSLCVNTTVLWSPDDFSKTEDVDRSSLTSACAIIWSGFVV